MDIDDQEAIAGVYGIWCGDDVYVGQSVNIMGRWREHMRALYEGLEPFTMRIEG